MASAFASTTEVGNLKAERRSPFVEAVLDMAESTSFVEQPALKASSCEATTTVAAACTIANIEAASTAGPHSN